MTVISKAALAAELGVSKSRVSQYLTAGLPQRPDGKLDRETALNWIGLNLRSGNDHRKGPSRARALLPAATPPARSLGDAEAARRAAVAVAEDVAFYVAATAADLDLPMKVVYALATEVQRGMQDLVGEVLRRFRVFDTGWQPTTPPAGIDWPSMAEGQDEPFDMAAWQAYQAEMEAKAWGEMEAEARGETAPSEPNPEQ